MSCEFFSVSFVFSKSLHQYFDSYHSGEGGGVRRRIGRVGLVYYTFQTVVCNRKAVLVVTGAFPHREIKFLNIYRYSLIMSLFKM